MQSTIRQISQARSGFSYHHRNLQKLMLSYLNPKKSCEHGHCKFPMLPTMYVRMLFVKQHRHLLYFRTPPPISIPERPNVQYGLKEPGLEKKPPAAIFLRLHMDAIKLWIRHTNKRGRMKYGTKIDKRRGVNPWKDISLADALRWHALYFATSLTTTKNKRARWSRNKMLANPWFIQHMSGNRYRRIMGYLHICCSLKRWVYKAISVDA